MSNHSGSYLVNEVIGLLRREQVFDLMEKNNAQKLVLDIVNLARQQYDCNPGEILEGHTDFLKVCYYCLTAADEIEGGLCLQCRAEQR
jgi:hypothetical protein